MWIKVSESKIRQTRRYTSKDRRSIGERREKANFL
jgi:hypothetical protein